MFWSKFGFTTLITVLLPKYISLRITKKMSTFALDQIQGNEKVLEDYVRCLNKLCPAPFGAVTDYARASCPELAAIYEEHSSRFLTNNTKTTDKGANGKYVEFSLFGILPNSDSNSDLLCGYDVKATHFKKISDMYNAKERLTITNCGTKSDYTSFKNITDNEFVTDCKYYVKMQKGVVFVFLHESQTEQVAPLERLRNKKLLTVFLYNLAKLPEQEKAVFNSDYALIRKCIADQAVSQRNQQYLHIHKHGTKKNPNTCALGFTNRFLTKLASVFAEKKLITKGRSCCVKI
jgi:hypothetical protein